MWSTGRNLNRVIRPVHYGIANYAITTIDTLKEAQELPELFMKSKNEMVLWRMLRRVSDRVKVELDQTDVDKATQVNSYSINKLEITLDKEKREIVFKSEDDELHIEIEIFEKQPSRVFKLMLGLVGKIAE